MRNEYPRNDSIANLTVKTSVVVVVDQDDIIYKSNVYHARSSSRHTVKNHHHSAGDEGHGKHSGNINDLE